MKRSEMTRWFVAPELIDGALAEQKFWAPQKTRQLAESVARQAARSAAPGVSAFCVIDELKGSVPMTFPARHTESSNA